MYTQIIRHTSPRFQVEATGGPYKGTHPVSLPSPFELQSGIPKMLLMQGLQWYLEQFLAMVTASMIKAGIRCVNAMAYSLYVSGEKVFLPAFYKGLFQWKESLGDFLDPAKNE